MDFILQFTDKNDGLEKQAFSKTFNIYCGTSAGPILLHTFSNAHSFLFEEHEE
jgi:hypothetical protein